MNNLIFYLLQSGISLVMLYLIYWFFLRKDTFFMINRVYIIVAIIFSMVFPLLRINLPFSGNESPYIVMLDTITITASGLRSAVVSNLSTFQIISIVYLTGASIFLVRFIFQLGQLILMIRKQGISHQQGLNIIFIDQNFAPFSFFNLIFINRKELNEKNIKEVITHEKVHIRQRHSIDLICLEVLTIVQWFNPFVWFYRNSLKSIHEYLADEGVLLQGFDAINYQKLLLAKSTGIQVNDLTNNFNHSLIKKRIIMMTRTKSTFMARLKLLLVTPVAMLLVVAFTASPIVKTMAQNDKAAKIQAQQQEKTVGPEDIFTVVEVMPKFPGGDEARTNYLVSNIVYPESARKAGIQGTAYVTFVVEKDGSISNVKVLRGFDKECDEVALNVVQGMPNWEPGMQRGKAVRVQFNMPIKFSLGDGEKEVKDGMDSKNPPPPPPPPSSPKEKK